MSAPLLDPENFYVCERCNACCKWPGDVIVDDDELQKIADFLGMEEQTFIDKYTRLRTNRSGLSLLEKKNHECIMFENGGCRINPVKPVQCAGFPNTWNFPGWQKVCEAKPVSIEEAKKRGLITYAE